MNRYIFLSLAVLSLLCACGDDGAPTDEVPPTEFGGGKADESIGPITNLSCNATESFIELGGFVEVEVRAFDEQGRGSRNYTLEVLPNANARVVQRNKVIFDEAGGFTIRCSANDSKRVDSTAVMVGYKNPALSASAPHFVSKNKVRITGRAIGSDGVPANVKIDGLTTNVNDDGTYDATLDATMGELNRFKVVATDGKGETSDRNVYVVVGDFGDLQTPTPDAVRLSLAPNLYPELASVMERVIATLPAGKVNRETGDDENLFESTSGKTSGVDWEFHPRRFDSSPAEVTLTPASDGITVSVFFESATIDALVKTDATLLTAKERELRATIDSLLVTATLRVDGPDDLGIKDVAVSFEDLDVELEDFPDWVFDLFQKMINERVVETVSEGIEESGNAALVGILEGFGVEKDFTLPEPLGMTLKTSSTISTLKASNDGVAVGLSFAIDGDIDPLRANAPGPIRLPLSSTEFTSHQDYQFALGLEPLNDLFFATWQIGALDLSYTLDDVETPAAAPKVESLTAFVDPILPPIITPTGTPGVFDLVVGEMRIDAVMKTELGTLNTAVTVGAKATLAVTTQNGEFKAAAAVTETTIDVLVAPLTLEREAVEEIIEEHITAELLAEVAQTAVAFPIPEADLSEIGVGLNKLAVKEISLTSNAPGAALAIQAQIEIQ